MKLNLAMKSRIFELCQERNWSIYKLATKSLMNHSTLSSFLNSKNQLIKLGTLYKICYGCDISIKEFFDSKFFDDVDFDVYSNLL